MKKILTILVICSMLVSSCGSSKYKCDAYGNKSGKVDVNKNQSA